MLTLLWRSLGRVALVFAAVLLVLVAFQFALVAIATSFAAQGDLERLMQLLPGFLQHRFGPALSSFAGMATVGFLDPVPVLVIVLFAMNLATEPAGEVEAGLVDLVLARPLPRRAIISRSIVMMTAGASVPPLVMAGAMWLGLYWLAPAGAKWPEPRIVALLVANLAALAWCCGAAALAAAAFARRRGIVQALGGVAAIGFYLVDVVSDSWAPARAVAWLSPFHYVDGTGILSGTATPLLDFAILGAIGGVALLIAYWQFNRRDL